ncbi:MAG TPA: hypothetical protein VMW56_14590 [Candidatus Margulisiibacteriota bacterium]|nr:hypothetical protein [Candidatus Margulisiibacteriota bacterium]
MTRSTWVARCGVALLGLVLFACHPDERTPQGVAERFVDQYYVQINLAGAKQLCAGLAAKKLEDEERLTAGQAIDESTRKPLIRYSLIDKKEEGDRPSFVFEGRIQVDGADTFTRKWIITTRREGDAWRVANFEEFD